MLSAVYIKGFKTFARPIRMPLTGGVTVIVGPNGSGKSNITDAVLFALGEGSPSLLRAGLMSDLIFSGSDSLPPARAAEVTLVLDNAEGHISLPYEEVSLTRRISRDGETEYRVNGVRARLADVRAVAGEAGLGRHSILRQGAVDAIVSGGAAACRTALEEAAGLGVFRRRRLAASRKLERAAAQLESSRRLEAELSDQLRRIEAEAVAAREYRKLEARYRELSLAYLYRVVTRNLDERREHLASLDSRVAALRGKQESLREEGRSLGEEEKKLEDRILATERILQGLEQGSEALQAETIRAERALLRLEGAWNQGADHSWLASLEGKLYKSTLEVRRLEEEVGGLEKEHLRRKEAFERLEDLVARGRVEQAAAAGRLTQLMEKLDVLQERREGVVGRLEEADALRDEEMERLGEIGEKLGSYALEGLHARSAVVLGRLEELREVAAGRVAEANRRWGVLATLIGRTEAEIRALRASDRAGAGKRLYEVIRPRPGYEAAVEAALGDLTGGVLAETLNEGMRLLSGENPTERVVVRLDAEGMPKKNGAPPGKPLLDCVEILDPSYTEALERLLDGAYVLEGAEHMTPERGYDVAVTREGLRLTRTSASRHTPDENFVRRSRLAQEEERLDALKNQLGEQLYDLREAVFSASRRLNRQVAKAEAFVSLTSRATRVTRLLASEAGRRSKKAEATREQRSANDAKLRKVQAEISAIKDKICGAREAEKRAKEDLDATSASAEAGYAGMQETLGQLVRARADLQSARQRRERISRGLSSVRGAGTADANARRTDLARRAARHARRLDAAVRIRLTGLRHARSDAAKRQVNATERHAGLAEETGAVAEKLAKVQSEAATLGVELSRAEEAARAAEAEIFDEWGATLENAREAAEALPETTDAERGRLARKLKNFGDVNLLAIGQEGRLRERHEFVAAQRSDAEAAADEIKRIIRHIDGEIEARFNTTFREVERAFASMVPRMMEGATGELELSEEGVEIGLRLRGRGWRPLRVLSGGERSLLALAFLFSIFLGRSVAGRRPFCMLDEAEAALDDINLARFLAVIDSYRADGQFLLVTHQKRTMAAADVLYGVTPDASGATVVVSKRLTGE